MSEAPDLREQEDRPSPEACGRSRDQRPAENDADECERCEGTGDRYGRAYGPKVPCPDCVVPPEVGCTCGRDAYDGPGKQWLSHAPNCRALPPVERDCNGYALGSSCECATSADCPASRPLMEAPMGDDAENVATARLALVKELLDEATGYSVPYRRSRFMTIDSAFTNALRDAVEGRVPWTHRVVPAGTGGADE